jgi:hypothetical protein
VLANESPASHECRDAANKRIRRNGNRGSYRTSMPAQYGYRMYSEVSSIGASQRRQSRGHDQHQATAQQASCELPPLLKCQTMVSRSSTDNGG